MFEFLRRNKRRSRVSRYDKQHFEALEAQETQVKVESTNPISVLKQEKKLNIEINVPEDYESSGVKNQKSLLDPKNIDDSILLDQSTTDEDGYRETYCWRGHDFRSVRRSRYCSDCHKNLHAASILIEEGAKKWGSGDPPGPPSGPPLSGGPPENQTKP